MELGSLERCCTLQELGWQGASRCVALLCSLQVRRTQGQSVQACTVGHFYLLTPAQIFKGKFTWAGDILVCNLNSLGPIHLHACCTSSRLTACFLDPWVAENRKRSTAEWDGVKQPSQASTDVFMWFGKVASLSVRLEHSQAGNNQYVRMFPRSVTELDAGETRQVFAEINAVSWFGNAPSQQEEKQVEECMSLWDRVKLVLNFWPSCLHFSDGGIMCALEHLAMDGFYVLGCEIWKEMTSLLLPTPGCSE